MFLFLEKGAEILRGDGLFSFWDLIRHRKKYHRYGSEVRDVIFFGSVTSVCIFLCDVAKGEKNQQTEKQYAVNPLDSAVLDVAKHFFGLQISKTLP